MAFRIETATCLTGRYDDAVEQMRLAVDLDPLSQVINANYGIFLGFAKRYEEGALQLRKTGWEELFVAKGCCSGVPESVVWRRAQ